jgi:hypothetical protein
VLVFAVVVLATIALPAQACAPPPMPGITLRQNQDCECVCCCAGFALPHLRLQHPSVNTSVAASKQGAAMYSTIMQTSCSGLIVTVLRKV